MQSDLYDMPKAFFQDDVAQDYYDTVKKLIREKHESAELLFTELKEMMVSGYRTGKKDGELEEGWNSKTNEYEYRHPRDWARMQNRKGRPKSQEHRQDTTDDSGAGKEGQGDSVESTATVSPPRDEAVEESPRQKPLPLAELKDLVDSSMLGELEKIDKETLLENLPEEGRLTKLDQIQFLLEKWQEKVGMLLEGKQSESLLQVFVGITNRISEVDEERRKTKAKELVDNAKKEREKGKIVFKSFKKLKEPVQGEAAMPGVDYLEAEIAGQNCRIYAGQDFLNTEYSQQLFNDPPTKSGNIAMYQGGDRYPDTEEYKCLVVGDAHHRFLWGAHHGQTLTAQFEPHPFAQTVYEWKKITYKHNPKHEYTFDVDEGNDPLKANANTSVKKKLFLAAVSPLSAYAGKYEKNPGEFIQTHLGQFWKEIQKGFVLEEGELKKVKSFLDKLVEEAEALPLDHAVKRLVSEASDKELAAAIGSMIIEDFSSGSLPTVALGDTPSVGYYDPDFHVIVLDPRKNKSADALLDTLAFEVGNAKRRDAFLDKQDSTTNVEFGTMNDYVNILLKASKSSDISQLVEYLKIPEEHLEPAAAEEILKMDQPALPMPDKTVMPDQKLRSALAWWKMKDWKEEERLLYFSKSAHAEGMGATGSEYKK